MNEIVKALNEINGSIVEFQGLLHADLLCLKHELMEANENKQKELEHAKALADDHKKKDQKIDALKDYLNSLVLTIQKQGEVLDLLAEHVGFWDGIKNVDVGNYDCCKDDKKKKKR